MATILSDISRTFNEYLLIPRLTRSDQRPELVDLSSPLGSLGGSESSHFKVNIPLVSACMQAVSGPDLAVALARQGGLSFIFCSQPIENQVDMIRRVKGHKAGFVTSDTNVTMDMNLRDVLSLMRSSGHSTVPVTSDGSANGLLRGIITDRDFWEHEDDMSNKVKQHMTPIQDVIFANDGISLRDANGLLRKHKTDCLPILSSKGNLVALVFKKDYEDHRLHPLELLDASKRLCVGAAINTHDYVARVPALVEAGADVLCFDSSDGFNEHQMEGVRWIRKNFGRAITLGVGNVVSAEGFDYLAENDLVDFVKVGIGGGSICITREQKGVGRGQASALMDIVERRNNLAKNSGRYIPICSDGGLSSDTQIVIALAMGADFVMMGRYFAMTDESPTAKTSINGQMYKPYWGEGTRRAQNWQRYSDDGDSQKMIFEEGVDAYVPLAGPVSEIVHTTLYKLRSTMVNVGADNLAQFREQAILTMVSEQSVEEAGTSNVRQFSSSRDLDNSDWGNRG